MAHPDVLVVGAGINGLATALELARRGLTVKVIDKGEPARESTWAGSGILCPLPPWQYPEDVNRVALRGMALFEDWARGLQDLSEVDCEYTRCGMAVFDPDPASALAWCAAHGLEAQTRDAADISPELARGDAIWLPGVATARNPRLARSLYGACLKLGVAVLDHTPALSYLDDGERVTGMLTPGGVIEAERYVLAAGAWSSEFMGERSGSMQVWPQRGQILLFRTKPGRLPCVTLTEDACYLVPRLDGLILAGSTQEAVGFDKSVTEAARQAIQRRAGDVMPILGQMQPELQWAGLRPASPDFLPTVGRHPDLKNLYANAGHRSYGVTEAPATAEHLAALMLGETPLLPEAPLAWRRQGQAGNLRYTG